MRLEEAHALHGRGLGGGHAARRQYRPGLVFFDGRENLGGKYGWKIVIDVHGRKRVHSLLACKW